MMNEPGKAASPSLNQGHENVGQDMLAELAFEALKEKRRTRRWGIFFKSLFFLYLVVILLMIYAPMAQDTGKTDENHTAMVSIEGLIASGADASAENIIAGLRAAFESDNSEGIILHINSPGGSPVQAGQVYDEIQRLREAFPDKPIYAVAADLCASGGYYIAAAAQKIYANQASIVGSIGVRADGFGFVEAMDKLGISRRLYTAGESKAFLDPFSPQQSDDIRHIQAMLDEIHQQFITAVQAGRGERLQDNPQLFSGLVWTGDTSVALGLVDELADIRYVAEDVIGAEEIVDYTKRPKLIERLFNGLEATLTGSSIPFATGPKPVLLP
jgi:protease-4